MKTHNMVFDWLLAPVWDKNDSLALVALGLWAFTLFGCVVVPSPVHEEEVSMPTASEEQRLNPGESVVIFESFGTRKPLETCLTDFLSKRGREVPIVSFESFREALYPWFEPNTFPSTFDKLHDVIYDNKANTKLRSLSVRYLIQLKDARWSGEASGIPPWTILPAGVMWAREDYDIKAAIWDLKRIVQIDEASIGYYGYTGMANYVLAFGIAVPPLQTTACEALAEKLHAFLIGRNTVTSGADE